MLEKLALWYLRKRNLTVLLNCEFSKRITIRTKDKILHSHNHYIDGTTFLFKNGNRMVLEKKKEVEVEDEE